MELVLYAVMAGIVVFAVFGAVVYWAANRPPQELQRTLAPTGSKNNQHCVFCDMPNCGTIKFQDHGSASYERSWECKFWQTAKITVELEKRSSHSLLITVANKELLLSALRAAYANSTTAFVLSCDPADESKCSALQSLHDVVMRIPTSQATNDENEPAAW